MKNNLIKGKQFLLGIQLALAVGSTTIARNNGQTWINSLLIGAGTFSVSSMITDGKKRRKEESYSKEERTVDAEKAWEIHKDAIAAWKQDKTEEALEIMTNLKKNYQHYFNNSNACFFLGTLLRAKNRSEESVPCFERFAELNPDSDTALSSFAECLLDIGQSDKAIDFFTRAIEINSEDSRLLFNRGVAYASLDNLSLAYQDWEAALSMGNEGAEELVKEYASYVSEEISVDNFKLLLEAGNKSREKGELKASRISYDKAINLGIQLLRNNIRADLASAYQGRGTAAYMAGANAQAVKDYRKSEKYSDGFPPETAAIFGHALSLIEENSEAIKYYDKAIEFEPTQRLYFERGVAKSSINDAEGSLIDYTTAIAINAESELTWKSYANRGVIKAHRGDFLDAEKDLLAGLELNPNDHTAREWLARTYSGLKKYDQSYEQLTKILDLDPTYWEAYRLRGSLSLGRYQYELALPDLKKYAENYDKDEEVREQIEYIEEKLNTLVDPDNLLNPSENLEEWRNTQALLCRNAAYIQRYENYIETLEADQACEVFKESKSKLHAEYLDLVNTSSKYKDAYYLFRLRNLTYATMAVNMNGELLENREAFGKYFLHQVFDVADTILREKIRGDEIDKQFEKANELEQYIVYSCSLYCNKLLNLIDGGTREERDKGENYDKFLEIQSSIESKKMVDEIYVVREAMIWTIASTNVDLVTCAEDSDAFEAKAFELLSKTNMYGFDYGNGPYRREDIVKALCKRIEWGSHTFQTTGGISTSDYLEKLLAMTEEEISAKAIGKDSSLTMREFLNRWGQTSKVEYGIDDLRKSVINDYAYLCYQDGGTQPDETSLEQYKKNVEEMSIDELVSETSVIETSEFKVDELIDYIELWLKFSKYAAYDYEKTSEGGSILKEVKGAD